MYTHEIRKTGKKVFLLPSKTHEGVRLCPDGYRRAFFRKSDSDIQKNPRSVGSVQVVAFASLKPLA